MIDINFLKENNCIIYEVVSGSVAYGLNHKDSDLDIRGVFILPKEMYYGFSYVDQVSDETNDTVYYEIGKFLKLLAKSNPTILEVLHTPEQFVNLKAEIFPFFDMTKILSKQCYNTFANYAFSQVKKARGLNKKIVNPMDEKRKELLDFCTVTAGYKTKPLKDWAAEEGIALESCGLIKMDHCQDLYALFWTGNENVHGFRGLVAVCESTQLLTSSIPKGINHVTYLSCSIDAYKRHCREYREYWAWVKKRNEARYAQTVSHGKNYDAKNMMHTFRLLAVAEEVVTDRTVNVFRPDRNYLLSIKAGDYEYDELLTKAEQKIEELQELYERSDLPETPDEEYLEQLLITVREKAYN